MSDDVGGSEGLGGSGWWEAGRVGCIFTKVLIPLVEREVGAEGVAQLLRLAGHPREYLVAEYNTLPVSLVDKLVRHAMELLGEEDEERWARRFGEETMEWKPSREQRGWGGAYTMSFGSPRAIYARPPTLGGLYRAEVLRMERARVIYRLRPSPAVRLPRWACTFQRVILERFPTNWGLPRAVVIERGCAALGDPACELEVRWKNPALGPRFWGPVAAGVGGTVLLLAWLARGAAPPGAVAVAAALPLLLGVAVGRGLLDRRHRREVERLRDLLADEVLYSSKQLETKFHDLHAKVDQLSLLIDLARVVSATLDPERIYDQALERLVQGMGYQGAHLFLVDAARQRLRGHRMAGRPGAAEVFAGCELPLDATSVEGTAATSGHPVVVEDVDAPGEPVDMPTARTLGVRSLVSVPLTAKDRVLGALTVVSDRPAGFAPADVELIAAIANHVALAIDKAESFQTIEELSRGLEDKVRVRTEQLRATNDELQAAYRELQAAQAQLIQREKMASVGQLVAGVAHELNNPIGFVASNVATLEDFAGRLRTIVDAYRAADLPPAERARLDAQWRDLKVDYALRYLDPMIRGIKEGAERTRKIVRDLRVFARTGDDVWQAVDLHEELESSLTLLSHLLKDRVSVHRKYGELPSVECIRSQIDQVFLNVLANAAQAIAGPGSITIETRAENGCAVVAVTDTGGGVDPDVLGRVFDPFFTTKPVGEGTGLGLSISYEIVKKHGGEIAAASPPGQGATFTIRIPLARRGGR